MAGSGTYRWRKTTDINREHALFELLDDDNPLVDVGFTDEGVFEVAFNPSIGGKVMEWDQFLELIREGRTLAERDR
jgi:hypothetical protein